MSIPWQPGWPANYPNTKTSDVRLRSGVDCEKSYIDTGTGPTSSHGMQREIPRKSGGFARRPLLCILGRAQGRPTG